MGEKVKVGVTLSQRESAATQQEAQDRTGEIDHLYANESVVQISRHEVRLSFFDLVGDTPKPRTGVAMPLLAALELFYKLSQAIDIIQHSRPVDVEPVIQQYGQKLREALEKKAAESAQKDAEESSEDSQ